MFTIKELQRLIQEGSDEDLLRYVRGDYAGKIEAYIQVIETANSLHYEYLSLLKQSAERELALEKFLQSAGVLGKGLLQ